ncbi:MAG: hypothetical protein ACI955_000886 [Zhongshania sp.]
MFKRTRKQLAFAPSPLILANYLIALNEGSEGFKSMALFELYSKRKRRERGGFPDVYKYDEIPQSLRVQIIHLIKEIYFQGDHLTEHADKVLKQAEQVLCREYGLFHLVNQYETGYRSIAKFLLEAQEHECVLDVVEILFRFADNSIRKDRYPFNPSVDVDAVIKELNGRFKEAGIGFQFESGELIRVDSEILHSGAVKPLLALLRKPIFATVNQEFLLAHENYRHASYEASMVEANKSLESMLKVIADEKGWEYAATDTAKKLIAVALSNGLVPSFMQNQLNTLQSLLESGVPSVRNKMAGHGQGATPRTVPPYMAEFSMHLTASTLLMLAHASGL